MRKGGLSEEQSLVTRGLKPRRGSEDPFKGGLIRIKTDLFDPRRKRLAEKRQALRAHLTEAPDPAHIPWHPFVAAQLMAFSRDCREVAREDRWRPARVARNSFRSRPSG
jgi:hypothetical protein